MSNLIMENFHSHLDYCRHGIGRASTNATEAKNQGLKILGFSEHTPFPRFHPNDRRSMRMAIDELPIYLDEIEKARAMSPIPLWSGLELDIGEELEDFYESEIFAKHKLDFCLGSLHSINYKNDYIGIQDLTDMDMLKFYLQTHIDACSIARYDYFGHSDRFYYNDIVRFDDSKMLELFPLWQEFLHKAKANNKILEFNTSNPKSVFYTSHSPLVYYWQEVAKLDIKVIVNSDAHSANRLAEGFSWAYEFLAKVGVKPISFYNFKTGKTL